MGVSRESCVTLFNADGTEESPLKLAGFRKIYYNMVPVSSFNNLYLASHDKMDATDSSQQVNVNLPVSFFSISSSVFFTCNCKLILTACAGNLCAIFWQDIQSGSSEYGKTQGPRFNFQLGHGVQKRARCFTCQHTFQWREFGNVELEVGNFPLVQFIIVKSLILNILNYSNLQNFAESSKNWFQHPVVFLSRFRLSLSSQSCVIIRNQGGKHFTFAP